MDPRLKLGDIDGSQPWTKTKKGRRVYNRKKHLFTAADIVRLQNKVGPARETSASVAREILKFAIELVLNISTFVSGQKWPDGLSGALADSLVRVFDSSPDVSLLLDGIDVIIEQRAEFLLQNKNLELENRALREMIRTISSK